MVDGTVIIVIHTWPAFDPESDDEVGRIVSARKARGQERKFYEEEQFSIAP